MSPKSRRKLADFVVTVSVIAALWYLGAGWFSLIAVPYGMWNFYDGKTRGEL